MQSLFRLELLLRQYSEQNSEEAFATLVIEKSGANINLQWLGVSNEIYQLQSRTNLILGSWNNLGAPMSGNGTTNSFLVSLTNAPPQVFYRVILNP